MTIWQILIYWLISEMLAWGLWWFIMKKLVIDKMDTLEHIAALNEQLGSYPATQSRLVEWIRFIVWPWGIIQRTVVVLKMRKNVINE